MLNDKISDQIKKNEDAVQMTYQLYANVPPKREKPEKIIENDFDDNFSKFKSSIQKARETLTHKESLSINDITPSMQNSLKKLQSLNNKTQIEKINNMSIEQKERALSLDKENSRLKTQEQKSILAQKLDNLKVNREISNINNSIATSLVNNISKV